MISQQIQNEQAVLGAMLIDARCVPDVMSHLTPDDFYSSTNRELFEVFCGLHAQNAPIDYLIVLNHWHSTESNMQTRTYTGQLIDITPTAAHVMAYVQAVKETSRDRKIKELALSLSIAETAEDKQTILAQLQQLSDEQVSIAPTSLSTASVQLYAELDKRCISGNQITGLPTGYATLDKSLSGLNAANMVVLAARSGMGKSAMALNIATHTSRWVKVLYISLEMSTVELTERVYAAQSGVTLDALKAAKLHEHEWNALREYAFLTPQYDLQIVDAPNLGLEEIAGLTRKHKPGLLVIDHIGLIKTGKYANRREGMDDVSRGIKTMAKQLGIPIIAVAQLNREIMNRRNKTPMLSDLRDSGAIEQDADVVLFVDRPAYYGSEDGEVIDPHEARLIVSKNRHGQTCTIPLRWFGELQTFLEGEGC